MELVSVDNRVREIRLVNNSEVNAARLCFGARATKLRQKHSQQYPPSEDAPAQQAAKVEHSACRAIATALHDIQISSFTVRGDDVATLRQVLTDEMPVLPRSEVIVPVSMTTESTIVEMNERQFELYASYSPAYTASQGFLRPPQTA
jgi:hypothetical protein